MTHHVECVAILGPVKKDDYLRVQLLCARFGGGAGNALPSPVRWSDQGFPLEYLPNARMARAPASGPGARRRKA